MSVKEPLHPYSTVRVGLGAGVGLGIVDDESAFPYGGQVGLAFPIGERSYLRGDVVVTYAESSENAEYWLGGGDYADTYLDLGHLLIALRPAYGYAFSQLISMRMGGLIGDQLLWGEQGICGSEYTELDTSDVAVGASGALGFHTSSAEFSLVVDAYWSEATTAYCAESGGYGDTPRTGDLLENDGFNLNLMAMGTYLL
jgi:hypothetical protein